MGEPKKKKRVSFNVPATHESDDHSVGLSVSVIKKSDPQTSALRRGKKKRSVISKSPGRSDTIEKHQPSGDHRKNSDVVDDTEIEQIESPSVDKERKAAIEDDDAIAVDDGEMDKSSDGNALLGNMENSDETDEEDDDNDISSCEGKPEDKDVASISDDESSDDVPDPIPSAETPAPVKTFGELSLDPRLERAVEKAGWKKPTAVQSAVIPIALQGRDVLVTAATGSGKTAAYAIPVIQHICRARSLSPSSSSSTPTLRAVILVPTRELVHQVTTVLKSLCRFIDGMRVSALYVGLKGGKRSSKRPRKARGGNEATNRDVPVLQTTADIAVGTPAAVAALQSDTGNDRLCKVEIVIVDEADLVLSYGYESDTRTALASIPTTAQSILLSATLESVGMDSFRKLVLRRPLTVKVTSDMEAQENGSVGATHYLSRLTDHMNRYLVTYAMLRLNVLCGKVLIFVNQINTAFKLKLFLDQFKVKSAVLNSELPANSRIHCVQQFNAGIFDILIAADDSGFGGKADKDSEKLRQKSSSKKRSRPEPDQEFGLSRGVDFKDVAAVLNFDVPESAERYTHRAGRTARGGSSGTVLSLVCSGKEQNRVLKMGREIGLHIGPLAFRMEQVEAFRYRVEDCLRLVTDTAVTGARLADVRREMINSEHLQGFFQDNPGDLDALQHNLQLAKNVTEHLGHIPNYLMPPGLKQNASERQAEGAKRTRSNNGRPFFKGNKRADPLKGFSVSGSSRDRYRSKHGIRKRGSPFSGASAVARKRKRRFSRS